MSELSLETFVAWRSKATGDGFVIWPTPRKTTVKESGRLLVTLGNLPMPAQVPSPTNGLTMLYGFRDAIEQLQDFQRGAIEKGMQFRRIAVKLQVKEIIMGTLSADDLKRTLFANLRRVSEDLQLEITREVNKLARRESKAHCEFGNIGEAGARPDLLCRAVKKGPLAKLQAVVFVLPANLIGTRRGRQVAAIFTNRVKSLEVLGDPLPFDVELPALSSGGRGRAMHGSA